MKIEKAINGFSPILLTIETKDELNTLMYALKREYEFMYSRYLRYDGEPATKIMAEQIERFIREGK